MSGAATIAKAAKAAATEAFHRPGRDLVHSITGVVVSAGKMDRTVKVRFWGQRWEKKVSKSFQVPEYRLVHDPHNSVRQGDVIAFSAGWRTSRHKKHVVRQIVAPYGVPIEDRPPVPSEEELYAEDAVKRKAKLARRAEKEAAEMKATEAVRAAKLAQSKTS